MPKKELTAKELQLQTLAKAITPDHDPLESEIDRLQRNVHSLQHDIDKSQQQLNSFRVVEEPVEPEPHAKSTAGVTFGITGVLVLVLFLFHCLIWLLRHIFNITWDTWGWTTTVLLYGVIISAAITALVAYSDKKRREKYAEDVDDYNEYVANHDRLVQEINGLKSQWEGVNSQLNQTLRMRFDTLGFALNSNVGLPFPMSAVGSSNYNALKGAYLHFLQRQEEIKKIADKEERMQVMRGLMDEKLEFVYTRSIKAEVSPDVYREFSNQFGKRRNNEMVLRQDLPVPRSKGFSEINSLPGYKRLLDDDTLTPIVQQFEAVANRDTSKSGFLSFLDDTDKKAAQTKDMQALAQAAKKEYDELMDINAKVSYALDFARACAYRNIYLGTELVNYVRATHAGGSMTKQQDDTDMSAIQSEGLQMDLGGINVDVSGSALNTLAVMGNAVLDNRGLQQLVKDNPKVSLGIAAVATIGTAAVSYFSNLSKNANAQKQMVDAIKAISEGYTEGKANMLRAIEIIGAIVNCNRGFMKIYEPLRKKIFDDGNISLTRDDQTKLAAAINNYKKVADTKMK